MNMTLESTEGRNIKGIIIHGAFCIYINWEILLHCIMQWAEK